MTRRRSPPSSAVADSADGLFRGDPIDAPFPALAASAHTPGGKPKPPPAETKAKPHFHQHRERLRARFEEAGPDALADYELLELLLFRIIPRRDTKPLAKALIATFGDFSAVLAAAPHRLAAVEGAGPAVALELKILQAAVERAERAAVRNRDVLSSWTRLIAYCRTALQNETREQFRVLFLDRKNFLIQDEVMGHGTIDHAPVYPREIVRRALELGAASLILVHNHPSGDPKPSTADLVVTREIIKAAATLEITVHDHLVVGRNGVASFKSLGLL